MKKLYQIFRVLNHRFRQSRKWLLVSVALVAGAWYIFCLPDRLFTNSFSTVLLDKGGRLLGAKIAADGQWRFTPSGTVPTKFETCLLEFEDRTYYHHPGISIKGICRALAQNIRQKRVVSGGSTITMQLARLMRRNPPRTMAEKLLEMVLATRLELRYSKREILAAYISNAPFGNNVVGLEAASWRYFGRGPQALSWAESAVLAVLPNAPGLIYPGRNHKRLLEKRNRLLKRLYTIRTIDKTTYLLALSEPLPEKPLALPRLAPHLLTRLIKQGHRGKTIISTIDINIQQKSAQLLAKHHELLSENKIYNGAILVTSVKTGKVLAYIGNTRPVEAEHSGDVDCLSASRSTGSILKPFLYAKSLEDGLITPWTLLQDIPTQFGGFSPKNFSRQYDGAVAANKALARSLNIPMVRLLNEYGLEKFHRDLTNYGLSTLNHPARHYGLSLILGGAEARADELCEAYTCMAQELRFGKSKGMAMFEENIKKAKKRRAGSARRELTRTNRACIYKTFEAMVDVNRPDEDGNWRAFASAQKIAWKTGTSYGYRDGWAIGITPDYVVTVWVGNADGEGRPGLTGIKAAAPLLFDVFAQLPKSQAWFEEPKEEMCDALICSESGHRASELCLRSDSVRIPKTCLNTLACPYHQTVHLDRSGRYRVDSECEGIYNIRHTPWFVLPPPVEKYYKFNHPSYKLLPPYKPECLSKVADKAFALLYPKPGCKIYVPVELDGNTGRTVFEATHRDVNTKIYWHLDDLYLGETREIHQLALNPGVGEHRLTLVDENGISLSCKFEILGKVN